ncbi:uncharacterized protein LOC130653768 [Hydractinia symbiolongicarpus]|uniref:uncharacterized protein LOC130653768 n=1 Tax=Hydractinia symbiolongicarpus TaxID=13093 RepID=UPI00254F9877|nr:uncharacterized protein LOC130653768 [Hydractinia symbiolongicarpus]
MHNYFSSVNPTASSQVEKVLREEIAAGNYVISATKPLIVSALSAIPKPDTSEIRLIHDCSMPPGNGVNSYIDIERQKFQTLDEAARLLKPGYFMAKVDLRHAYRSVPVHPSNWPALGLKWKFKGDKNFTYLVDTRLPFGGKSAPGIFHRLTQAVRRMMARRGFSLMVVYLDDFLVIGSTQAECQLAFKTLCTLLVSLGFELSPSKIVAPCQRLTFLGVVLDTVSLTLSLPAHKLSVLKDVIALFLTRKRAFKKQLQQLAGRLNWACKVVYGGRTFLRRVLDLMNTLPTSASKCRLTLEFHRDMVWWDEFLDTFNGQCDFHDKRPVTALQTDACSSAVGGFYLGDWFYSNLLVYSPSLSCLHINFKEALCVVLSAARWASAWRNKTVHVYCDNTAAVSMLNKGTTRNPLMMKFLRQLFWLSATYNFRLKVVHVPDALGMVQALSNDVIYFRQANYAESTKKNYRAYLTTYKKFCYMLSVPLVPATTSFLCLYAAYLAKFLLPQSLRLYILFVGLLHKEMGFPNPLNENWILSSVLKGIRRVLGVPP